MEIMLDMPPQIEAANKLSLRERQAATLAVLDLFMEQDEEEHRETLRVLQKGLKIGPASAVSLAKGITQSEPDCAAGQQPAGPGD